MQPITVIAAHTHSKETEANSPFLKKLFIPFGVLFLNICLPVILCAQGTHVFPSTEVTLFNELHLSTNPSLVWTTDRSATPGYFSAVGEAIFSGAANGTHSLIDGYVKYYRNSFSGATSFVFPVGQVTSYKPVRIAGAIPANGSFGVAWYEGDPNIITDPTDAAIHSRNNRGPGVLAVLPAGFWDWQTLSGVATGMSITVSIPDVSTTATANSLILVGWNGSNWINLSGAPGTGPYSNNWATGNTEGAELIGYWQPDITALAIGSLSFILPLKLESFIGRLVDCQAELTWKTTEEVNTSHFIVTTSLDGIEWKPLTHIPAQGNGNGKTYHYKAAITGYSQRYRLVMTDLDGKTTHSPTINIINNCAGDNSISVLPNPVTREAGSIHLALQTSYSGKATLLLRNISGQVVSSKIVTLQQGMNRVNLETVGLTAGTYLVTIVDKSGQYLFDTQKVIKH